MRAFGFFIDMFFYCNLPCQPKFQGIAAAFLPECRLGVA